MFTNSSKAYTWLTIVNIVTGLAALLTVTIVNFIKPSLALQLRNAFMFLPNYCFAQGLSDVYTKYGFALCYYTRDANVFFLFFFPHPCLCQATKRFSLLNNIVLLRTCHYNNAVISGALPLA